ncbi:MAG: M15 family metallopeptidase [Oscillospiraceae bacterium]|nr:M15 family metallopeptidase [Oscillospiraceae bacterium]
MMRVKRILIFLLASLCIQGIFSVPLAAEALVRAAVPPISISSFLSDTGLTFESYHRMMSDLIATGVYPHFLEKNAQRYDAFQAKNPDMPFGTIVAYVNVNADRGFYSDIEPVPFPYENSALVNKHFALPPRWMAGDLVYMGSGHRLRGEAAAHFAKMRDAITADGLRLQVMASFRTYQTQADRHSRGVRRHGLASADRQFARAGHSEHQLGLAVDVLHRTGFEVMTQARFQNTEAFSWLMENAYQFGFILRYPYAHTHIHGYIFEPWHWRFVGVEIATAMHHDGIALFEEFYGRYLAPAVLERVRRDLLRHPVLTQMGLREDRLQLRAYRFGGNNFLMLRDLTLRLARVEHALVWRSALERTAVTL